MARRFGLLRDRLFLWLSIISLVFLAYVGGVLESYYNLPPSTQLTTILKAGKSWIDSNRHLKLMQAARGAAAIQKPFENFVMTWDKARAYNGYNLIVAKHSDKVGLLDMQGNLLHEWNTNYANVWKQSEQSHLLITHGYVYKSYVYPNGDLLALYTALLDTPYGYGLAKFDKDSNILWTYDEHAHHDFYIDETNQNIYTLTQDFIKTAPSGFEDLPFPMLADYVTILSPEGKELRHISVLDAFKNTPFELMLYHRSAVKGAEWDHLHTNSIMKLEPSLANKFPMFKPGQILISIRNLSTIAVIDPDSGKVVWAQKGVWAHQHSAKFTADGTIIFFDNEGHISNKGMFSQIIALDPKMPHIAWNYAGTPQKRFFSNMCGVVQPLPNGNILITDTMEGEAFEVTPDKQIVWDLALPSTTPDPNDPVYAYDKTAYKALDNLTRVDASQIKFLIQPSAKTP